jgi:hypothetical protein
MRAGPKPGDSDEEEEMNIIDDEDGMDSIVVSDEPIVTTMNIKRKYYISVRHMPKYLFRNKLIAHFSVLYKKDQIFWPRKKWSQINI